LFLENGGKTAKHELSHHWSRTRVGILAKLKIAENFDSAVSRARQLFEKPVRSRKANSTFQHYQKANFAIFGSPDIKHATTITTTNLVSQSSI